MADGIDVHNSCSVLYVFSSYEECLKECGLTTLKTRRLRGDFKKLNGHKNIDRS